MSLTLLLLAACSSSSDAPAQLEAGGAELSGEVTEYSAVQHSGALSVSEDGGDYLLHIDSGELVVDASVHSPTGVDLSALDGLTVDAELLPFGFEDKRSLLISDDAGLLYVLDAGFSAEAVNALLGEGRVSFGEAQASDRDDTWTWTYTTLRVEADEGPVELLPGEVTEVQIDGVSWRVGAIAAYDREARPRAPMPGCPVLDDVLSYELLRVSEPVEDDFLLRPEGLEGAALGCI